MTSENDEPTIEVTVAGFDLPVVEVLTGRGVIFGKSGSGKSNSIGVIAEQLLDQGFPLCIVDTDGEHYGLKEEYEILHVGAAGEADVVVSTEHAEALAEVMLEQDVPVILDVSEFIDESEAHTLVERVVGELFAMEKTRKKPFPVIVEEIHEFVPEQKGLDTVGETIVTVAKRGRKRGLGVIGASQRPAEVKKSLVTQASWSIWHKLTFPQDTKVVRQVFNRDLAEGVQDLDTGEAIFSADWMDEVRTVQFKQKRTFDAGATPGLEEFETPELKGVSDAVIERLNDITEEKEEEERVKDKLEQKVERLEYEKERLEEEVEELRSGEPVESEEINRLQDRVEALKAERDRIEAERGEALEREAEARETVEELEEEVSEFRSQLVTQEKALDAINEAYRLLGGEPDVSREESELHDRIEELEAEREQLKQRLEQARSEELDIEGSDYFDFIKREPVQEALDEAKEEFRSPGYIEDILSAILAEQGPVTLKKLAELRGVKSTTDFGKARNTLEKHGLAKKVSKDGESAVDLNIGGIEEILRKRKEREELAEIRETYL